MCGSIYDKNNGDMNAGGLIIAVAVMAGGQSKRMGRPKETVVIPGDGNAYRVSEGTTTYQVQEETEDQVMKNDLLISPAGEYDHSAEGENNMFFEYYNINEAMGGEGQIVYGFDESTLDLKEIVVVTNGDEMTASYYYVNELTEPDESYVQVPDLSGYTQE